MQHAVLGHVHAKLSSTRRTQHIKHGERERFFLNGSVLVESGSEFVRIFQNVHGYRKTVNMYTIYTRAVELDRGF